MSELPRNVRLLTACQALTMSIASFVVFVGSIIGKQLSPQPHYATLPVAAFIVGSAVATLPVIYAMRAVGRKSVFIACALIAAVGALVAIHGLKTESFSVFLVAVLLLGIGLAAGQQYRFAAMESVVPEDMPRAASRVLIGGIVAAFLGPELAVRGADWLAVPYAGSFMVLAGLVSGVALLMFWFIEPKAAAAVEHDTRRRSSILLAQPVLWVALLSGAAGYAVMSLVMTATPLHMHFEQGHDLLDTKWVIQSHIVAMFLPSFFVPWIVRRVGEVGLISLGAAALLSMVAVVYARYEFHNYWSALVLLGVGWNFLFVGGTTLLPRAYREAEKFKVQAFNDFSIFAVQAISALGAGWILASYGWQVLLLLTIPILGLWACVLLHWLRSQRSHASAVRGTQP